MVAMRGRQARERRQRGRQEREPDRRGLRGLRLLIVGLGVLVFVVAVLWLVRGTEERHAAVMPELGTDPEATGFGPGARAYSLFFVDAEGGLVSESRAVAAKRSSTEQIAAVLEELLAGSLRGFAAALPEGTQLRNLFADSEGTVYVDLTGHVARDQGGSLSSEYATLAALVRTVLVNFPEFGSVQVLVDGEPALTLAGHFNIERPLTAAEWLLQ